MRTANICRIFVMVGIISLSISYLGIWIRFINDATERTGSDFIAFYSAGRIAQVEGIANVYSPKLQKQIQQEQVGFPLVQGQVLLYNHLPFLIPILQIIVSTNYVASFYRWIFLLVVLYVASVMVLSRTLNQTGIDRRSTRLAGIGALLFLPAFFSLMNGQDTAFLFLGAAVWVYGLLSGKETLAGLGLGLTTVRPHIALFLAIPMLFRSTRVFVTFMLSSGILALFSAVILGLNGVREFIDILLLSTGGEWHGMKENAMYNLIGLLTRTVPGLEAGTIRALGWLVYVIAMICMCVLWFRTKDSTNGPAGLSITIALFVAPHLHFHDLTLLLIPIYELIRMNREAGSLKKSIGVVAPIAVSLLLLLSNISPSLQYTTPYLIMLVLAVYPYYSNLRTPITTLHRS